MKFVILDAMENENSISSLLINLLQEKGEVTIFKVVDMSISPCRSCGSCGFKSPGKCIVDDDIHEILKAIAKCDAFIMLTPIRFGGYPSCLKKVVDKFMLLALPSFIVKNGHLLHPARYDTKTLVGIGISDGNSGEQEESFKNLVANNALNVQYPHKALVLRSEDSIEKKHHELKYLIGGFLK